MRMKGRNKDLRLHARLTGVVLLLLATACTPSSRQWPEPLRPPKERTLNETDQLAGYEPRTGTAVTPAPGVVPQTVIAEGMADRLGEGLTGDDIRVSFHDLPLVAFINEVFAEQLGMSFHIAPGLRDQKDLVTLKLTEPISPSRLFAHARTVLRDYGVDVVDRDGLLTFTASQEISTRDIPLIVSGRTLPEVPATHRLIFQLVPVKAVPAIQVTDMLKKAFVQQELSIESDYERNALLLRGPADLISRALDIVEVLDQPLLRGRRGIIVEPTAVDASVLAQDLSELLGAEGYTAEMGLENSVAVHLLPLRTANKLVVFAADKKTLDHVEKWARLLDAERRDAVEDGIFTHYVENTNVESVAETLSQLIDSSGGAARRGSEDGAESAAPSAYTGPSRLIVDKPRNMLLYRGSGEEWGRLLPIIDQLDQPVPSVLIEVLIAEVTLSDMGESGIEFIFDSGIGRGYGLSGGTLDTFGLESKALSLTLDSAGVTRGLLNLFYDESRIVIHSRPRLVVKSGETANFEGGNEIPTVVQAASGTTQLAGSTNILQQIDYRQTGVTLEIEPTVQANGLVDLRITQDLSEARPAAATSLSGTPTILNRRFTTSITLRDGGSLLIGGLIADNSNSGQAGVPGIARVPLLGRLFRKDTHQRDRTELVVMVIPYVIVDHEEGRELTERVRSELELHDQLGGG